MQGIQSLHNAAKDKGAGSKMGLQELLPEKYKTDPRLMLPLEI